MENKEELLIKLSELAKKEIKIEDACSKLNLTKLEILSLVNELKSNNTNILKRKYDDGIYLFNKGEKFNSNDEILKFKTDENHEFKFVAISDLRIGSKSQQLSILNDIYQKAYDMGYRNVIICGNLTEGLYKATSEYADTVFLDDTLGQIEYIIENFPKIEGMKTYFITGKKDKEHMKKNMINIGKRISEIRKDMFYLGDGECKLFVDNTNINITSSKLSKTYTLSYRPQKYIDSLRSEDKPDIIIGGGLLQMEKFNYRDIDFISVPSVCATTKEMDDNASSNTIGAWYMTIKTNEKGKLDKIDAIDSVYYRTIKEDYKSSKVLEIIDGVTKKRKTIERKNEDLDFVNKIYRYIKDNMPIEEFMSKFHINNSELMGIIELCDIYDKELSIIDINGTLSFRKDSERRIITNTTKTNIDDLVHTQICLVSDTHLGSIHQQLHLLNQVYEEAYKRGITTILHCGDIVDGNYPTRPENPRQQFLSGFDQQVGYIVDMYPAIKDLNTYYILGSHDETHYKTGQATANAWISRCRKDMIYLGQDYGITNVNGVSIAMDHPGGGSSYAVSYQPQKRIETLESGCKPKILAIGHYHKNYSAVYRNVRGISVPSFCDKTQFQQKKGLLNVVGGYFLDIYSDKYGNIQYFEPEEILFDHKDMWEEAGKDKKKVKQLVIN